MLTKGENDLIKKSVDDLRTSIKDAKKLQSLFTPRDEYSGMALIEAPNNETIYELKNFLGLYHLHMLDAEDIKHSGYGDPSIFRLKLVNDLLLKANNLISTMIGNDVDRIATKEKLLTNSQSSKTHIKCKDAITDWLKRKKGSSWKRYVENTNINSLSKVIAGELTGFTQGTIRQNLVSLKNSKK